ncbi:MAG: alpha-amylase [Methanolobus sp.]|nr:alpha-amylase [Methanolobus sp.]
MRNGIMMQYFEFAMVNDGQHWNNLKADAAHLSELGITAVLIPPCFKGTSSSDTGYSVYDLYDLGEFDQKGTVRTKYGTKDELIEAINALHDNGIKVYADIVLNHKAGGDETQKFKVVEVEINDRTNIVSEPYDIDGWTKFTFPGRDGKYSDFKWSFEHFTGTDNVDANGKTTLYKILGKNKDWAENVDKDFGNFDYLMYADVDYDHPDVKNETHKWFKWFVNETKIDGVRIDAIKHINQDFIKEFLKFIKTEQGDEFFVVGEYWKQNLEVLKDFLGQEEPLLDLFDVPLHFNLYKASKEGKNFDMRTIFDNSLVKTHPQFAVTFVDNHDSQPMQSLGSFVEDWFKPLAYALILLRKDGYPTIFFGDYYGIANVEGHRPIPEMIDKLIRLRKDFAYGEQLDYFDHGNTIGWTRLGNEEHPNGCAVVLTNGSDGEKEMSVGTIHSGEVWIDRVDNNSVEVVINEHGMGIFPVSGGSVSCYTKKE